MKSKEPKSFTNYFIRFHRIILSLYGQVYGVVGRPAPLTQTALAWLGRKSSSCSQSLWARVHCSLPLLPPSLPFLPSGCLDVCLCTHPSSLPTWRERLKRPACRTGQSPACPAACPVRLCVCASGLLLLTVSFFYISSPRTANAVVNHRVSAAEEAPSLFFGAFERYLFAF